MKLTAPRKRPQCSAIVQPGEYLIDRWDGKQCEESNGQLLAECPECEQLFCVMMHWPKHHCWEDSTQTMTIWREEEPS